MATTERQPRSGDRVRITQGEHAGTEGTLGQYRRTDDAVMDPAGIIHPRAKGWEVWISGSRVVALEKDAFEIIAD